MRLSALLRYRASCTWEIQRVAPRRNNREAERDRLSRSELLDSGGRDERFKRACPANVAAVESQFGYSAGEALPDLQALRHAGDAYFISARPLMIRHAAAIRNGFACSPRMATPTRNAPIAPMPVQML